MARRGYDGTTMRDLAQATDRSLSGLYHYFRSKEELLFLINFRGFTHLNDTWDRMAEALPSTDQRLFAFIFFHLTYFVEHMDQMRVMTWGTRELESDKARLIQKLKDRYANNARSILLKAAGGENKNALNAKRAERQTYLLFGMMNWIFGWYSSRKHGTLTDLINDVYTTYTRGFDGSPGDPDELACLHEAVGPIYSKAMAHAAWDHRIHEEDVS